MKLFKNKKADGTDYFAALEEMSAIAAEEAALLKQIFVDYKSEQLETYRKEMHALEHRCDTVKHNMVTALTKEFLPPVNREDLFRLAHLADDFTDAIESVVAFLYMANVSSLKEDTPAFAELISDSAQTVVELFKETTHDLNEIFACKDIRCRLEGESELKASAHPAICQLLLANLCRNAYVHTPQAGTLRIVWGNKDFSICNTGPKALDSSHIFQRFYKDSSNPGSTGLGLSLCQAICQQYQWPITYSYKKGEHIFHVALCPHPNS